ncbi:MAG: hypothetical protein ACKVU0_16660 [Saprospiraceae bacterium]
MDETIHRHVLRQPFGYAGDFLIIDKIYTKHCSDNFGKWDQYFHRHAAPKAVRNRKDYFKQNMVRILRERKGQATSLLNMASSPARMIALAMQAGFPRSKVQVGKESEGVNLFMHLRV